MAAPVFSALRRAATSAHFALGRHPSRISKRPGASRSLVAVPVVRACSTGAHCCCRNQSDQFRSIPVASHCNEAVIIGIAAGSLLALAEVRRSKAATCESVRTVSVGKVGDFEEGGVREVSLDAESTDSKGPVVLVQRHGEVFTASMPMRSQYSAPLRRGVTTFMATCKVNVAQGAVYVEVPEDVLSGAGNHHNVPEQMTPAVRTDKRVFALIGSGPASLSAAETLRQEGFAGRIVMITCESHLPYDRTMLSKVLDYSVDSLLLRTPAFFEQFAIELVKEARVMRLDSAGREIHYQAEGANQVLKYDKVLVASGGSPRKLFLPGAQMEGIFTLRTPEDAARISKHAKKGSKMVVVGGSFIGMEVASMLRKKGCDVTVIALETVPFERVLGKKVGSSFARVLQKEGVQWCGSSQVRHFRGNDFVSGVELEDGEVLPADGVVVGAGVLPNTRFIEGVSLDKDGAIIVSPFLNCTAAPSLFAAGDVCSYPAVRTGTQVRIEHWEVATQQGRTVAKNMLDQHSPFTTIPFFWSDLFGRNLRFVGHAPEMMDRVIIEGDVGGMEFVSYYTQDDRIWAVATVGRENVATACAELMRLNKMPSVSQLMLGVSNADDILKRLSDLGTIAH